LPPRRALATWLGIAFALAWPFFSWEPIASLPASGILAELIVASALAVLAFGINKRSLQFFGLQRVGWRDTGAAVLAFAAVFGVVTLAEPAVNYWRCPASPDAASDVLRETSLWFALTSAVTAGVFEEFIYRGFLIEELGELIRSRRIAAVVAVICFALAHHVTNGWSLELIYPGLIGAVIAVLYLQRRNLPVCMLLHATLDSLHALTR